MLKVGLMGDGKTGQTVAEVLPMDRRFELCWVARCTQSDDTKSIPGTTVPITGLGAVALGNWLDAHRVDALVDCFRPQGISWHGEEVRRRLLMLLSAISSCGEKVVGYVRSLGVDRPVSCFPDSTVGTSFQILAARLLRSFAPFADVEILEQHVREKPEASGTARKIAENLAIGDDPITAPRLRGKVGHPGRIFGFPCQPVRLIHDSIHFA